MSLSLSSVFSLCGLVDRLVRKVESLQTLYICRLTIQPGLVHKLIKKTKNVYDINPPNKILKTIDGICIFKSMGLKPLAPLCLVTTYKNFKA